MEMRQSLQATHSNQTKILYTTWKADLTQGRNDQHGNVFLIQGPQNFTCDL